MVLHIGYSELVCPSPSMYIQTIIHACYTNERENTLSWRLGSSGSVKRAKEVGKKSGQKVW